MSYRRDHSFWADTLLTALAPAIWGSTYIVTTELLPPDRPVTAALLRTLPAGLVLLMLSRHLPRLQEWGRLAVLSSLNIGFFQVFLFMAAYRLPGGPASVVGAIQPLMVMGLAWAVDRHAPANVTIWAALSGIAGMAVLLLSPGADWDPMGIAAALGGAACMAAGTYLSRRWHIDLPVLSLTGWQLLLGGVILLPAAWLFDPSLPALNALQIVSYAYLSIFGAVVAYGLWFRGIRRLSPVAVSSLGLLSPVTAVVLGWLLLGESLHGLSLFGAVTVLGSILAVQLSTVGDHRSPVPPPSR